MTWTPMARSPSIGKREPRELLIEIANTLAANTTIPDVIWLCEGKDDKDALAHHAPGASVYIAGNKKAVLACAAELTNPGSRRLESRRWQRAVDLAWFLVDRDYDDPPDGERIVTTTTSSLESDLLVASGSAAVKALLLGIDDRSAERLAESALHAASQTGLVRHYNHKHGLGLRLNRFPMDKFIASNGTVDWRRIGETLCERNIDNPNAAKNATNECSQLPPLTRDQQLMFANGHDLIGALQTFVNRHSEREGVSLYSVFRALVSTADPSVLEWLQAPRVSKGE